MDVPETSPIGRGWWARRSDPQRFDLYTRASLHLILLFSPLIVLGGIAVSDAFDDVLAMPLLLATVVQTGLAAMTQDRLLRARVHRAPTPRLLLAGLVAWSVLVLVLAVATLPVRAAGAEQTLAVGAPLMVVVAVLSLLGRPRNVLVLGVLTGLVVAASVLVRGGDAASVVAQGLTIVLVTVGLGFAYWSSLWMLDVVWGLDSARRTSSALAVAEERLRFSRDLHDVMGRHLSVIAVRTQVAEQLARRGRDGAAEEMEQVRGIAEGALREMREVVRGYRTSDLAVELNGARSVLTAAGIDVDLDATGAELSVDPAVRTALAWVLREGTTNVIRHSDAVRARIALTVVDQQLELLVRNDGVREGSTRDHADGNGLAGLSERLTAVGGTLQARRSPAVDGGSGFELRALIPLEVTR